MKEDRIHSLVRELTEAYDTNDPFAIASKLNIEIVYMNTRIQKGFCKIINGFKFIFINENLSSELKKTVCAHELGHLLLQENIFDILGYAGYCESNLSKNEMMPNIFAANLLITDEDILSRIGACCTYQQLAGVLDVHPSMLYYKITDMNRRGYSINVPVEYSNLLK